MSTRTGIGRWAALGVAVGVFAAWGSFGIVGAVTSAPTTVTTCTKASTGKSKVIAPSGVAKCTAKGKGFAQKWAHSADVHELCVDLAKAYLGEGILFPPSGAALALLNEPFFLSYYPECVGHSTG